MRVEVINPFLSATADVIEALAHTKPKNGKPRLKNGQGVEGDVTGIIGLASAKTRGTFAVSFDESTIVGLVTEMFGEPPEPESRDVMDAVGEIANQISGSVRARLEPLGYDFEMALPTIILGRGHRVFGMEDAPAIVIPFQTDAGSFTVEFCLYAS